MPIEDIVAGYAQQAHPHLFSQRWRAARSRLLLDFVFLYRPIQSAGRGARAGRKVHRAEPDRAEERRRGTTTLLDDTKKKAKEKMDALEGQLVKFKAEINGRLPDQATAEQFSRCPASICRS
jgi:hypothetical protein